MNPKKILSNFVKWYKKHPVTNLFAVIEAIRTGLWVVGLECCLMIDLLNWI